MKLNYGTGSLGLIGFAIILGIVYVLSISINIGLIYILLVVLGAYLILMNYCRKCPHSMNDSCKHYLPGRIAKKLPYKKTGKYTLMELTLVLLSLVVIFILPIVYMIKNPLILIAYIGLWTIGVVMIRMRVCTECYNRWCVMCPNRVKQ